MSYYVKRSGGRLGFAYVGPIRSERQAEKEAAAWISCGHTAEVQPSNPAVRADVRAWTRAIRNGSPFVLGGPLWADRPSKSQ
jgi:hypothetical protein